MTTTLTKQQIIEGLIELSPSELREVATAAEQYAREKGEQERKAFIEETAKRAGALGITLADIFGAPGRSSAPRGAKAKVAGGRANAAVKYRGPNGEVWSGRGRPARWITQMEAEGRRRSEFAV